MSNDYLIIQFNNHCVLNSSKNTMYMHMYVERQKKKKNEKKMAKKAKWLIIGELHKSFNENKTIFQTRSNWAYFASVCVCVCGYVCRRFSHNLNIE